MILHESWATSIRLPIGNLAKRGDVAGRTVESGVGSCERARCSPEGFREETVGDEETRTSR
jgi:hypothetical protein